MPRPLSRLGLAASLGLALLWTSAAALARGGGAQLPPADPTEIKDDPTLVVRWVYDDLERGFAQARKSDKPLLIVFR